MASTASSTIVYEIEPGNRLGWHTDATEETQYIIAGTGTLFLEDGSKHAVGPGSVFVLPTPMRHDLANTGKETLRAVAFFAAAMFTQTFDNRHDAAEDPCSRQSKSRRLRPISGQPNMVKLGRGRFGPTPGMSHGSAHLRIAVVSRRVNARGLRSLRGDQHWQRHEYRAWPEHNHHRYRSSHVDRHQTSHDNRHQTSHNDRHQTPHDDSPPNLARRPKPILSRHLPHRHPPKSSRKSR